MDIGMLEKMLDAGFNKSEILSILEKASTNTGKQDTGKQDTGKQDTGKQDTGKQDTPQQDSPQIDVDELAKKIVGMIQQGNRTKDNSSNEEKKKSIDEILTSAISARK